MKKSLFYIISIFFLYSCQSEFQFGKFRDEEGYEIVFFSDSTFCYNGKYGKRPCETKGIAKIKNRRIITRSATNTWVPSTISSFNADITILEMSQTDSSYITLNFFHYDDSEKVYKKYVKPDLKYDISIDYLNKRKHEWHSAYRYKFVDSGSITIKIPKKFYNYRLCIGVLYNSTKYPNCCRYLSDCYNYNIDLYYKQGDCGFFVAPISENITYLRRKDCIYHIEWHSLFWISVSKYCLYKE